MQWHVEAFALRELAASVKDKDAAYDGRGRGGGSRRRFEARDSDQVHSETLLAAAAHDNTSGKTGVSDEMKRSLRTDSSMHS